MLPFNTRRTNLLGLKTKGNKEEVPLDRKLDPTFACTGLQQQHLEDDGSDSQSDNKAKEPSVKLIRVE